MKFGDKKLIILIAAMAVVLLALLVLNITPNVGEEQPTTSNSNYEEYTFKNNYRLEDNFEKHGKEMGFKDAESYEDAASDVVNNPEALHKTEKEDGDDVYYVEKTNEFVVVSPDGYIRTYFNPDDGINYYNRQ